MFCETNVDYDGKVTRVAIRLSRRNILALLHKLDLPRSARTLVKEDHGCTLVVVAEENDVHYPEGYIPGRMIPSTEAFIAEKEGKADVQ